MGWEIKPLSDAMGLDSQVREVPKQTCRICETLLEVGCRILTL